MKKELRNARMRRNSFRRAAKVKRGEEEGVEIRPGMSASDCEEQAEFYEDMIASIQNKIEEKEKKKGKEEVEELPWICPDCHRRDTIIAEVIDGEEDRWRVFCEDCEFDQAYTKI